MEIKMQKNHRLIHSHWGTPKTEEVLHKKAQFSPPRLPFSYTALEAICDSQSLKNHFLNFHMKGFEVFLDKINNSKAEKKGMIHIFNHCDEFDNELIENASIVFSHQLYWDNLSPYGGEVSPKLQEAIEKYFGSIFQMKQKFIETGMNCTCCGWLWLIVNIKNELELVTTKMHINPLMKNSPVKGKPILSIDLWEHAYFQKFHQRKEDYLKSIWMLINWSEASNRFRFVQ